MFMEYLRSWNKNRNRNYQIANHSKSHYFMSLIARTSICNYYNLFVIISICLIFICFQTVQ